MAHYGPIILKTTGRVQMEIGVGEIPELPFPLLFQGMEEAYRGVPYTLSILAQESLG